LKKRNELQKELEELESHMAGEKDESRKNTAHKPWRDTPKRGLTQKSLFNEKGKKKHNDIN
jgi:hypothetical protein